MAKKLYVGNLSYNATEDILKDYFAKAGSVVSVLIITDKISDRSKGFGFVEMASDEEAAKAIETLNGTELDGRNISVAEARPMTERPVRSGGFDRRGGGYDRDRGNRNSRW